MKKYIIRRAGALVLALVLALTLAVPAWAAGDPDTTEFTSTGPATTAGAAAGSTVIPVAAADGGRTAVYAAAAGTTYNTPVNSVTVYPATLALTVGQSETLIATVSPDNATDKTVKWTSSNSTVATVDQNGKVTAVSVGGATITVSAQNDSSKKATCRVTVTAQPVPSLRIDGATDTIVQDPGQLNLTAVLSNVDDANPAMITWTVDFKSQLKKTKLPTLTGSSGASAGQTATLDSTYSGPGEFIVTATYGDLTATKYVTISGVVISGTTKDGVKLEEMGRYNEGKKPAKSMEMYVNESAALSVELFGDADDRNSTTLQWSSDAPSTVSVMLNAGSLNAWQLGTAILTVEKGNYLDECRVDVVEDESVIAGPYTASVSKPLNIGQTVYEKLNEICEAKTRERSETGTSTSSPLSYINNLSVATSQGTLYYNYVSESDTGRGIAFADQFAKTTAGTTYYSIDRLYFVPRSGFTGTAEITFQCVAANGYNFSGTIKVNVGMGSAGEDGEDVNYTYQISYRARAGEPAWFMASDFNSFCKSVTGREFSSVTFNLPRSSDGVLYYNYAGGTGTPVTTTTKFTPSGVYTIDSVCFVPNAAYSDEEEPVIISFQAVDSSGETVSGTVEVNVIPADVAGEPSNVTVFGEIGQPVTLQGELFSDACRDTIKDTLDFVIFKLPDPKEGVLYYNYQSDGSYESRVTASTRYYYSGVPGLSGVTFVPASGATGRIAIPYTGYGSTGTSYSGTLYIGLEEANSSTIRYSVEKNGSVTFKASDFYNAGLYQAGVGVDYVTLTVPETDLGTLYYDYRSASSSHSTAGSGTYYVSSSAGRQLDLISFHAVGLTGTVEIPYTAYSAVSSTGARQSFSGKVVIQVGAIAAADVNTSCNTGRPVGLSSYSLSSVCGPVMGKSMSYIEITSVPDAKEGRLYLNYNGFGTGIAVKPGDRFYRVGSPSIDRLTFVPHAGFTGVAEITYIGYSGDGAERASGRINVSVSQSTASLYFNDMNSYKWAIDSVDYLYQNRTVEGVGGGRYNPAGTITKGDFTLMLVRAYGLTASGSASFRDVPPDSYYADAIRIASLLGVADGSGGYYNPKDALSRQDAMLMIFNALKASGRTVTNGLAADLSAFYDEDDIAAYAREAVGSLVQMGVVEGNGNGYLRPRNLLNRAETAKLLHAIMTL